MGTSAAEAKARGLLPLAEIKAQHLRDAGISGMTVRRFKDLARAHAIPASELHQVGQHFEATAFYDLKDLARLHDLARIDRETKCLHTGTHISWRYAVWCEKCGQRLGGEGREE